MSLELPALPYDIKALEPYLSRETVRRRHGRLQRRCVARLAALAAGTPWADASPEAIARGAEGELAREAARAWALTFHWHSLAPRQGAPSEALEAAIVAAFGDPEGLYRALDDASAPLRGVGGWGWLVARGEGRELAVLATAEGELPLAPGVIPLLVHYVAPEAEEAAAGLAAFRALANWRFAAANLAGPALPA
ncbi:superoxide dismutase, Fe-Mn family [Halomonas shengliensis]|uniref:Superoxide dismutase n=1 Tax=Halomonas shengliensis TaxID=419597 RepID=A0A1H0GHG8_9GAMM|nr:Fe-Mn family superoxide dismutase [Halomonas shengliensis]SDO06367.1 superoxide dismutase, Fe-Mn family [Halomonas shengliensis]